MSQYVRKKRILSLEDAIYKMSGFAATRFKLRNRGVLRRGAYADVVVFDADAINDRATFDHPHRLAVGVEHVVVNGIPIVVGGAQSPGVTPGRYLRFNRES
ncbi:MAG: amidohydrolase family protein [Anaerolineales bacterium]|nr:amidohydrolase family protein [Anaerolineales bacterium]